jgi:hypothetical protein
VKNRRNLRLFNKPKPTKGLRDSEKKSKAFIIFENNFSAKRPKEFRRRK